ncbi:hypothetical protein Pelo_18187 [Pelomyxa schiedti]|nr:hypothetical protein Pelo_18187 [Pelomyxa schiedti]
MEVVAWLEEEFHDVVDALNSNQQAAEDLFVGLCMRHGDRKGKDVGLKWFLQHVSDSKITMSCISNAVGCLMRTGCWKYVPLVLDHFTQFEPQAFPRELEEIVMNLLRTFDMKAFQVLSGGGASSSSFTPEFVAKCLTSDLFQPESSKAVKWAISKFHLQYPHIKSNHHHLLFNLLLHGKNQCAHWLLTTFDIPLSDLVTDIKPHRWSLALAGWHIILDHYGPAIDAAVIRNHFMPLLSRDPLLGTHTMRTFGITLDEFRTCAMANPYEGFLSLEARTWLGLPSSC